MSDQRQVMTPVASPPERLVQVAGWCAYTSGIVSIFGIVFLLAFFTVGGVFGPLNDGAVIVQYSLMIPIALALHQYLRSQGPTLSRSALLLGVVGMVAVVLLQILLVTGVLSFAQQIGVVIVAFLGVLAWFVIIGYLGRSSDKLPSSMLLHVLAGLYIGYPIWAFSVGRRLLAA